MTSTTTAATATATATATSKYSSQYIGLDPLLWTSARLFIRDIICAVPYIPSPPQQNSLGKTSTATTTSSPQALSGVYILQPSGRFLRSVEIVGIVTSVDEKHQMLIYTVDDGTGSVSCVVWINEAVRNSFDNRPKALAVGTLVRISGRVGEYRGAKQLLVNADTGIDTLDDPNAETAAWMERLELFDRVYSVSIDQYITPELIQQIEINTAPPAKDTTKSKAIKR
ncbi:hypothetical protein GQ42DRAFT_164584 [Ramicandelaber brevisporus]|nr:hypothetical protein GQ42DRAFT_164584 [Ramicandelaber brevisporus]